MTEPKKAAKGDWDTDYNDDNKEGNEGSSEGKEFRKARFMKMSSPGKYIVRLAGDHVNFRKHFKPYIAKVQDSDKNIDPAWQAGFYPPQKSAVNVINKTDVWDWDKMEEKGTGTLEILEKGPSVFKHFANYKGIFGVVPSGKKGPNFLLEVKIPKKENGEYDRLKTEYFVTHLKESPFTKEEVEMIRKEGGLFPLQDIYKSTSAEKMKEMWDALSDAQKIAPKSPFDKNGSTKKEEAPSQKVEEKMEDSPADNGDDLFDGGGSDASDNETDDSAELF